MKRFILALALAGVAFSASNPSDFATVTLYDGDPAKFGKVLATAEMGDSPSAERLIDTDKDDTDKDDTVKYVTVEIGEKGYTIKTFRGGSSKHSIYLDINDVDHEDAMTLGELLEDVAADPSTLERLERTSTDVSVETAQRD